MKWIFCEIRVSEEMGSLADFWVCFSQLNLLVVFLGRFLGEFHSRFHTVSTFIHSHTHTSRQNDVQGHQSQPQHFP